LLFPSRTFPRVRGSRKFGDAFTRARHWIACWTRWIQGTNPLSASTLLPSPGCPNWSLPFSFADYILWISGPYILQHSPPTSSPFVRMSWQCLKKKGGGNHHCFPYPVFSTLLSLPLPKIQIFPSHTVLKHYKKTPWPEAVSKLYRPSDSRLSKKLVQTFTDRECQRDQGDWSLRPYSRLSRPDFLLHSIDKFSSYLTGNTIHLRCVARNSDHSTTEAVYFLLHTIYKFSSYLTGSTIHLRCVASVLVKYFVRVFCTSGRCRGDWGIMSIMYRIYTPGSV
jgi:hypothetical protein